MEFIPIAKLVQEELLGYVPGHPVAIIDLSGLMCDSGMEYCFWRRITACFVDDDGSTANSAARFLLRSPDPVKRLVRDGVLSEKEAQLGRMFSARDAWCTTGALKSSRTFLRARGK